MKIKQVMLKGFKRFHDLTINLGSSPKRIIALVGPNGCGKSSIFDAFEVRAARFRGWKQGTNQSYFSKSAHASDIEEIYTEDKAVQIITDPENHSISKKSFLIRSSYRFTSRLNVTELKQKPDVLDDTVRPNTSIDMDNRLTDNYERFFSNWLDDVENSDKTGKQLKQDALERINNILSNVLDIRISSLGNITKPNEGQLFFEKGKSKKFPYENLSSGEKEVIDIIFDLIVKERSFDDTIYCIDEPELHISTAIQRKLLVEIYKIIPSNCQLWIATHSIGFLRALQDELKSETSVIDFSDHDFDNVVHLEPMKQTRGNWKKVFATALEDLTGLVAPRTLIYCEGKKEASTAGAEAGLDAIVYNAIFENEFHDALFVSSGGNTEPDKHIEITLMILSKALKDINILLLKDKDIHSDGSETTDGQRQQWLADSPNKRMLKRKEIENYLFDFEVINKAYPAVKVNEYKNIISDCINGEVKDKAGALKELCAPKSKMNKDAFKIHLSQIITSDMAIYNELKECIFI